MMQPLGISSEKRLGSLGEQQMAFLDYGNFELLYSFTLPGFLLFQKDFKGEMSCP